MDKDTVKFLAVLIFAAGCLIAWGIAYRKEENKIYPPSKDKPNEDRD